MDKAYYEPQELIKKRARSAAVFVALLSLAVVETAVYLIGGFLPEPKELFDAGALYFAIVTYFLWYAVQYIYETAAYAVELDLAQQRKRASVPQVLRMPSEMRNHLSLARDNKQIAPLSPHHYRKLYQVLARRDFKISKRALKVKGEDGKYFVNIDGRYPLMMANWYKWGWLDGYTADLSSGAMYLSEKGRQDFIERGGMTPASPTQ